MGKYRKDFTVESDSENESDSHFKAPKFRDLDNDRIWKSSKKKSKQFRQARKKRSLGW